MEKQTKMKRKYLFLAAAALLVAGGLCLVRSAWRTQSFPKSSTDVGLKMPRDQPQSNQVLGSPDSRLGIGSEMPGGQHESGQMLRPPNLNRRFLDFTPEQRVEFARQGHGPGG